MNLINCGISLDLTLPANCVIFKADRAAIFLITDTKLNVPVVTLSTQDKEELVYT